MKYMKEKDAYDMYLQTKVRYEKECGVCTTRQLTEEEMKKYGINPEDIRAKSPTKG